MAQINNRADLRKAIELLEQKKEVQQTAVKGQYHEVKTALAPVNIVKNTYSRLAEIPEVRKTLINTVVGFALGYVAKKANEVMNEETMNRLVGNMVNHTLTKIETKDPDSFSSKAISFVRKMVKEDHPLYQFVGYRTLNIDSKA